MSELPQNWIMTNFGSICGNGQYGWTTRATERGAIKFLRTTDITKGRIDWNSVPYCQDEPPDLDKYRIQINDILISRAGSVGFSTLITHTPFPTIFASYLIRFVPSKNIEPRYIAYFLKSSEYWQQISEASAGIAISNVNAKKLSEISTPLAPGDEQKRIADKLDSLLARVNACRDRLDRVPRILKQFRQAILAAATSGQLVNENWLQSEANEVTLLGLAQIIELLKTGPFGSILHKSDYVRNGIPVVNPMHINAGRITPTNEMAVSEEKAEELQEYLLRKGDIVFARRGVMGRCAVVGDREEGWLCGSGSMIIRTKDQVLPEYLQIVLSSPDVVKTLEANAVGSTMVNLNQRILLDLIIPVPSITVQELINHQVRRLFDYADRLENRYRRAFTIVEQLTPALLDKAFWGDLVPQDPDDEPATVLLEQIRADQLVKPKRVLTDRKPKMPKMTEELVKEVIRQLPEETFSFDELRGKISGDYDSFKDILFTLLSEAEPSLTQVFDQEAKAMRFIRGNK